MTNAQKGGVPEISEAAKAKACELINAQRFTRIGKLPGDRLLGPSDIIESDWSAFALARFIQEADATARVLRDCAELTPKQHELLAPFILPEPVDPLVEVLRDDGWAIPPDDPAQVAERLRRNLAKRGLKIVEASKWPIYRRIVT